MLKKESNNAASNNQPGNGEAAVLEVAATTAISGNGNPQDSPQVKVQPGPSGNGDSTAPPDKTVGVTHEMPLDPFDPERLKLSQDFAADLGVKKAMLTVPVDKPKPEWWVRVRPEETYRLQTLILNMKEDREKFLIAPELRHELVTEPMVMPRRSSPQSIGRASSFCGRCGCPARTARSISGASRRWKRRRWQ